MEQKFAVTDKYVLRKIADESILVPVSPQLKVKDCLFLLNPTGCAVYLGVKSGLAPSEIAKTISGEFSDGAPDDVIGDIRELLNDMSEIEAIREC